VTRTNFNHWYSLCTVVEQYGVINTPLLLSTVGKIHDGLVSQYQSGIRTYHNLDHVAHCLEEFDAIRNLCLAPTTVELAIWYHDIIYDTKAENNEELSALRASLDLINITGVSERYAYDVERLILLTKHDRTPTNIDGQIIVDIDLSILGQSPEVFDRYEQAVRTEYSWVPDEEFWPRRWSFIIDMLSRKRIFYTEYFYQKFEHMARKNLIRSIMRDREEGEI